MTRRNNSWALSTVLDSMVDYGIVLLARTGRIRYWNAGASHLFQYTPAEVLGESLEFIYSAADQAQGAFERELQLAASEGRSADDRWHVRKDGARVWIDGTLSILRSPSGRAVGYIKVMRDATERKRLQDQADRLARVDLVTGLGNRYAFNEQLQAMAEAAARQGQALVLHLVDLDHFKEVNDRFGHEAGDEVLQEAAQRMLSVIRKSDFAARLGGDEFAILQAGLDDPEDGARVAQSLVNVLSEPFDVDGAEVHVGASIGLAVYDRDTGEPGQLLSLADAAMYRVKQTTRGGYRYASKSMDRAAHQRSRDRSQLVQAFRGGRFALYYQPQLGSLNGRIRGVEALLRCTDPELAHRSVDEIVELARGTGLMPSIGRWALGEACAQAQEWRAAGLPFERMCLNFGADEITDPKLVGRVQDALDRSGFSADLFEIELTEKQMLDYTRTGDDTLQRLREFGLTVAIDDFGTGYSALSYLTRLPVDRIKLDRSFVTRLPDDPQSCSMAQAIISLAHALHLEVVAEGVETPEQADYLQAAHCEVLQGFLYSRPLPPTQMTRWLQAHWRRHDRAGRRATPGLVRH